MHFPQGVLNYLASEKGEFSQQIKEHFIPQFITNQYI